MAALREALRILARASAPRQGEMNALRMFAGPMAKTADHQALARAQEMAGQGATRDAIWRDTGWFQGVDGKWRFEIDDRNLRARVGNQRGMSEDGPISHPELREAYPDRMDDTRYIVRRDEDPLGDFTERSYGGERRVRVVTPNTSEARSTAAHELQHSVQGAEDFARGGNLGFHYPEEMIQRLDELKQQADDLIPQRWNATTQEAKDAIARQEADVAAEIASLRQAIAESRFDYYRRMGGEVEARNVETRRLFTPEERRSRPPWETQDVPDDQQIVRFDGDRASNALGDMLRVSAGLGGVALAGDITLRELLRERRANRANPSA